MRLQEIGMRGISKPAFSKDFEGSVQRHILDGFREFLVSYLRSMEIIDSGPKTSSTDCRTHQIGARPNEQDSLGVGF